MTLLSIFTGLIFVNLSLTYLNRFFIGQMGSLLEWITDNVEILKTSENLESDVIPSIKENYIPSIQLWIAEGKTEANAVIFATQLILAVGLFVTNSHFLNLIIAAAQATTIVYLINVYKNMRTTVKMCYNVNNVVVESKKLELEQAKAANRK